MQQLVGSGAFQQWLDTTPLPSFSSQLDEFREEGAAYRALQKERFKDERENIAGQDTEVQAFERALSSILMSQGATTTDKANLKLPSLLSKKLSLLRSRQQLLQHAHTIFQEIEDADQGLHDNAARHLHMMLRMKQNLSHGRREPGLHLEMLAALQEMLLVKAVKESKKAELVQLRAEGASLESKIEGVEREIAELET